MSRLLPALTGTTATVAYKRKIDGDEGEEKGEHADGRYQLLLEPRQAFRRQNSPPPAATFAGLVAAVSATAGRRFESDLRRVTQLVSLSSDRF